MTSPFFRTTAWAIRDTETGTRISAKYRDISDAKDSLEYVARRSGRRNNLEIYRTSISVPEATRKRRKP